MEYCFGVSYKTVLVPTPKYKTGHYFSRCLIRQPLPAHNHHITNMNMKERGNQERRIKTKLKIVNTTAMSM